MNTIILNGNLRLHKDKYEFLIDGTNLTKVLEKIYFSDYPALDITVENEARRVFKKYGELMFNKNDNGNWVFHVEDFNLDEILFNQLNKEMIITIDAAADMKLEEQNDESTYVCKS